MSLTDYIKKATVGLAIVGALSAMPANSYAGEPTREEMQQEFNELTQLSAWYNANLAYKRGKKNPETGVYDLRFRDKELGGVMTIKYHDLDHNGPDLGDVVELTSDFQGKRFKAQATVKSTARVYGMDENSVIFE